MALFSEWVGDGVSLIVPMLIAKFACYATLPTRLVSTVRRCLFSQRAWYMSDGGPEKGRTGRNDYVCCRPCGFRGNDDYIAEKGDVLRTTSWQMITCDGYETVLLDGATDGIDVSSTVIRQAVAPYEFYQSSLLPTPTLVAFL